MNPQMNVPQQILPSDFDGTFRFTNWTDRDFSAKWGGKEYFYPALKTTPMVILSATPYEIQNIRKKFAKELAEREFFNSDKHKQLDAMNKSDNIRSFGAAISYTPNELAAYVQKCLEPLPLAPATSADVPKPKVEIKVAKRVRSKSSGDEVDDSLINGGQVISQ